MHARGIKLVYLPPYLPDLNPIKECFSFIKHYICHHGEAFHNVVELGDVADPFAFLYGTLDTVTAALSTAWFHHSGYL
jgi:hypothetical protein